MILLRSINQHYDFHRVAALPAVPPDVLLSLLEEPTAADESTAGKSSAGKSSGHPPSGVHSSLPEAVRGLLKDSVLTALVHLDDSQQVGD